MSEKTRTVLIVAAVLALGLGANLLLCSAIPRLVRNAALAMNLTAEPVRLPAKADSYTLVQFRKDLLAFNRRAMVAPYAQVGVRNPIWDEAAQRYLEACARTFTGLPDAASDEQLVAQGKALVDQGCTDPMVAYCYGAELQDTGEAAEAEVQLRRAVAGFQTQAYPRVRAFFAPLRLAELLARTGGKAGRQEAKQWHALAMKWLGQAGGEVQETGREPHCFLVQLSDGWERLTGGGPRAPYQALQANAKTPAYVKEVVGGWTEADWAWEERGGGWASEVTEKGWKGFYDHLGKAEKLLTSAWKSHPEYPEAPAAMIRVTMGMSRSSHQELERLWFTRATKAQLDYRPAYRSLLWALRPRWGGSQEAMYQLGQAALDTGRFDTGVPEIYLQAVYDIWDDNDSDPEIWSRQKVYANIQRMCEGYIAAAESERQRDCYRTTLAEFAWLSGHYDDARAAFDALGDRAQAAVFTNWKVGTTLEEARAETYALTGPAGASVREARQQAEEGKSEAALVLYEKAAAKEANPYAAAYLHAQVAALTEEQQYARGDWVDLAPKPGERGWKTVEGKWEVEPDGGVRGTTSADGLYLTRDAGFGQRVELEGEVGFIALPDKDAGQACLLLGLTEPDGEGNQGYAEVRIAPSLGGVLVAWGDNEERPNLKRMPLGRTVQFRAQLWDGALTTYIDGKPVHRAVRVVPRVRGREGGISIGSHHDGAGAVFRFSHLRVRKLKERPSSEPEA